MSTAPPDIWYSIADHLRDTAINVQNGNVDIYQEILIFKEKLPQSRSILMQAT